MNSRTELINHLIKKNNYTTYLEIGVNNGDNINYVSEKVQKTGVDPEPLVANYFPSCKIMTSDEFFKNNKQTFDIIFIDGLHHAEQVYNDICNSLKVLNKGGTIVCHDMKPRNFQAQVVPRIQRIWNGDCWRAFVQLKNENVGLDMRVYDFDEGCGVITKNVLFEQPKIKFGLKMDYDYFNKHQKELLNLVYLQE